MRGVGTLRALRFRPRACAMVLSTAASKCPSRGGNDDGDRSPRRLFLGDKAQAASASASGGQCNAHHWRLWICADYVRRLSGCLRTFTRPVEANTPPPERTLRAPNEYLRVEVAGIEPASRTSPVCRNYNHACSMRQRTVFFKREGSICRSKLVMSALAR